MPILPNSSFNTSRLGFGTSGIMGSAFTNQGRLKLLNYAFELGVTHFDTAPLYGMGEAETLVGKFIKNKRERLTVATKFGLNPTPLPQHKKLLLPLGRYINRKLININKIITIKKPNRIKSLSTSSITGQTGEGSNPYRVKELIQKLDESLQKLNTDYVDIYLLHECRLENLNPTLIDQLDRFIKEGKVLSYGLATNKSEAGKILKQYPQFKGCIQIDSNITNNDLRLIDVTNNLFTISHSAIALILPKIQQYLNSDKQVLKSWSQKLDFDLAEANALTKLLLLDSLFVNSQGIVLFSSSKAKNIKSNIEILDQKNITPEITRKLKHLIHTELLTQ